MYFLCTLTTDEHDHHSAPLSAPTFTFSTLEGFYVDDALQGQGMYTYEDGGVLHGTYVDGELNGPAQELDGEARLVFKGHYKDNNRCGECWVYHPVSHLSALYSKVDVFT